MEPLSAERLSFLERATSQYQENLDLAEGFCRARGLLRGTGTAFRLGVVAEPMSGHEAYEGRLAIPYLLHDGRVVQLRFRCLGMHDCKEEGHPKYLTEPGDDARLYNTPALFDAADEIHVTEGELDAVTLSQCGQFAVGLPGAQHTAPRHMRLLNGFSRIFAWGDGDEAGREFAAKIRKTHRRATVVPVPRGEDVTSLYVKGGAEALQSLLAPLDRV